MAEETKTEDKVETPKESTEDKAEEATEAPAEEAKEEAPVKEEQKAVEAKEEAPKPVKEEKPAPSGKFADMIKQIETMTVADLAELVKALEDRFGVSAAMPMAVAGAGAPAGAGAEQAEEKSSYTIVLKDGGAQKIAAIKAVREINQDLGLKEAKDLVDGAPKEIKKDVPKADAEEAKKKLEAAGATVELV
jgi:large subunit ribosomal protein L7/L12